MLVDPAALASGGRAWAVAGAMVATIVVTKCAAALATRPLYGFGRDEVGVAFGLTVPQAAATLAAALVGFRVGLFDAAVLNGTIVMMLVTCTLGPVIVERYGRRLAARAQAEPSRAAPPRVLVSLANPATAGDLLGVAALLREGGAEPVHAVTVAASGPDLAEHVGQGERVLARALAEAAAMDLPLDPSVRSGANVARALARAVAETRSSAVVLGWDGEAATARVLFGTVPDRLLRESSALVVVARPGRPLPTVRRVVVAAPPLADHEPGFPALARALGTVGTRLAAPLVVVTADAAADALRAAVARGRPGLPVEAVGVGAWSGLLDGLGRLLRPDDLVVLVSARQGSVSWRASLDRLPRVLARRFPDAPLWTAYPAQVPVGELLSDGLSHGDRAFLGTLTPECVRVGVPAEADPAALVDGLLAGDLAGPARAEAVRALLGGDGPAAELSPGVALLHAHVPSVDRTTLWAAVSPEGVRLGGAAGPVRVLLVLLVPAGLPTGRYLGQLALVTRLVGGDLDALARAATPAEARALLLGGLRRTDGAPADGGGPRQPAVAV